jgi:hypothetical protein
LHEIVIDKRLGKRATEKRTRRNRLDGKEFIKNSLSTGGFPASGDVDENTVDEAQPD